MLLFRFGFDSGIGIHWRLIATGPSSFPLRGTDWELLNPLLYHQTSTGPSAPFTELDSGLFTGGTAEIVLLHRGKKRGELSDSDDSVVIELTRKLLTRLRHVSGQASAPEGKHLALITVEDIETLPSFTPITPIPRFKPKSVSKYWFGIAVTDEHIKTAAERTDEFEPNVFETLFLDAIAAHRVSDFRSSVLYAAMSMEVALGTVIDAQYAKIIAGPHDDRYRVIRLTIAGGQEVVKDPVFEKLRREGENFPSKIHELSLYVMGKSLLTEDEPLFLQARNLYTTRNKLVHSGVVVESADLLPLDQRGSLKALETVKKVLVWLDVDSGICLPEIEFVPFEEIQAELKKKVQPKWDGTRQDHCC
jgi:hypothetical protein